MSTRFNPNLRGMSPAWSSKTHADAYRRELRQLEALGLGESARAQDLREFIAEVDE